jgi:hypothetical protein
MRTYSIKKKGEKNLAERRKTTASKEQLLI